jgi:hypothetical protein
MQLVGSGVRGTVVVLVLGAAAGPVMAQDGQLSVFRIPDGAQSTIRVDGLLSEELWSQAPVMTGFRQREPLEGERATEETEVRVAYDDGTLYVGVIAYDSEPERIVARILQRDKLMEKEGFRPGLVFGGDDAVAILFDPFQDNRNGVIFATNPNGAEFEALTTDEGSEVNIDWRGVWEVASTRIPEGWSAEFAIPWRTLRYPDVSESGSWGLNVSRVIRRKNEETLWRSWQREGGGLHRVSRAGDLVGLQDLPRAGFNVEPKPFALSGLRQEADDLGDIGRSGQYEVGLDLKTELRPGLLLDLTLNTDFAQVEVDDEQVNLTRFSLFFPEKRDFFLENAGIFEFGKAGNGFEPPTYQMFFSRRIGIHEDGEVPITGGARVTGRVGGQTVGFLNVLTGPAYGTGRENFNVARVKRDIGESAYVGAMVTDRRSSDGWSSSLGMDGQFTVGEAWTWDWYAAQTLGKDGEGEGHSYRIAYTYFGDTWGSFFDHYVVDQDMEAESGFVLRDDIRWTELFGSHAWRPERLLGLREFQIWSGGRYGSAVSDGEMRDWSAGLGLSNTWHSGDELIVMLNAGETVVDEAFELSDSVEVSPGRYRNDHIQWFGGTSPSRAVYLNGNGMVSAFFGGSLVSAGGTLTAAPSPRFSMAFGYTLNKVDIPDGAFSADIASVRATFSASTKLSTNVLVQYNRLDRAFSTNVRFNFIHRPGSDLFVVFTENRGDDHRVWNLQDRGLVMKVTYLMRL